MRGLLKYDVQKLKEKGIQCMNRKVDMTLRSVFNVFGNTTLMNFLSVGKEFRKWVAKHPDYKDVGRYHGFLIKQGAAFWLVCCVCLPELGRCTKFHVFILYTRKVINHA